MPSVVGAPATRIGSFEPHERRADAEQHLEATDGQTASIAEYDRAPQHSRHQPAAIRTPQRPQDELNRQALP